MDPNDLSSSNPLFPLPPGLKEDDAPRPDNAVSEPNSLPAPEASPAVDLIRKKIDSLYAHEPSAREEIAEIKANTRPRSKHQEFMYKLSTSGKSLADIQTEWHAYYEKLPDNEKHEVWQEFYSHHSGVSHQAPAVSHQSTVEPITRRTENGERRTDTTTISDIKKRLLSRIQAQTKITEKPAHIKSLLFGLGMGSLVVLLLLFGFFNERFIAPFITPSRAVSNTPIILDPNSVASGPEPKIIIPKINVEIPVVYDEPSTDEHAVQKALERGVVHYANTPNTGELGNGVIFGHSSNNILNKGKYKFAFVLLKRLENGDTFVLQRDGKRYIYKVFEKKVVAPTDVSVLGKTAKPATFTLITCDPPGTSLNRLVVTGEQISPDPASNIAGKSSQTASAPTVLPGNAPTLWRRIMDWLNS
jgi:sortase A